VRVRPAAPPGSRCPGRSTPARAGGPSLCRRCACTLAELAIQPGGAWQPGASGSAEGVAAARAAQGTVPASWAQLRALKSAWLRPGNYQLCGGPPVRARFALCKELHDACVPQSSLGQVCDLGVPMALQMPPPTATVTMLQARGAPSKGLRGAALGGTASCGVSFVEPWHVGNKG